MNFGLFFQKWSLGTQESFCKVGDQLDTRLNNYGLISSKSILIISSNEVFGDIMVLASPQRPRPRPPVDPDDVNTRNSTIFQPISFKFYMRVDTP